MPADPSGVIGIISIQMTPDLSCFAYSYILDFSDLFMLAAANR